MMSLRRILPLTFLALAACSGSDVRNTLGLNRNPPDEFVVFSRPPLVVPPEFELTPPRPGEEAPHAVSTEQQARKLLLGTDGTGPGGSMSYDEFMGDDARLPAPATAVTPVFANEAPTPPSASFLHRLGADAADPNIRSLLHTEVVAAPKKKEADSLYEELVGQEQGDQVVDPAKEAERLRANKDAGKPITEGETPSQDTTPKSVLEKVF